MLFLTNSTIIEKVLPSILKSAFQYFWKSSFRILSIMFWNQSSSLWSAQIDRLLFPINTAIKFAFEMVFLKKLFLFKFLTKSRFWRCLFREFANFLRRDHFTTSKNNSLFRVFIVTTISFSGAFTLFKVSRETPRALLKIRHT